MWSQDAEVGTDSGDGESMFRVRVQISSGHQKKKDGAVDR
jgi:hypothetical protein